MQGDRHEGEQAACHKGDRDRERRKSVGVADSVSVSLDRVILTLSYLVYPLVFARVRTVSFQDRVSEKETPRRATGPFWCSCV